MSRADGLVRLDGQWISEDLRSKLGIEMRNIEMPGVDADEDMDVLSLLRRPDVRQNPYPLLTWVREHTPVHANPTGGIYLVSRNADARAVCQSPLLRGPLTHELAARYPRWESSRGLRMLMQTMAAADPPEHTRLRRAAQAHFTPRQAQRLEAATQRYCDRFLAAAAAKLADGEQVDLHTELTWPLGMNMAADIIGIPESDRATLTELILQVLVALPPSADEQTTAAGNRATDEVEKYFTELAEKRRSEPAEDLISALLLEVCDRSDSDASPDRGISWDEFIVMLSGLWTASFETTVTAMDLGLLIMLDHPDEAHWLGDGPEAAQAFVSETLRYESPVFVGSTPRIAIEDFRIGEVTIPAGADVRILHAAANRDPEAFPDPDRFDPARDTSRMVTFGHGIHRCLGIHLARMECAVVLSRIHRQLPDLVLTERPVPGGSMSLRTIGRFPVTVG